MIYKYIPNPPSAKRNSWLFATCMNQPILYVFCYNFANNQRHALLNRWMRRRFSRLAKVINNAIGVHPKAEWIAQKKKSEWLKHGLSNINPEVTVSTLNTVFMSFSRNIMKYPVCFLCFFDVFDWCYPIFHIYHILFPFADDFFVAPSTHCQIHIGSRHYWTMTP